MTPAEGMTAEEVIGRLSNIYQHPFAYTCLEVEDHAAIYAALQLIQSQAAELAGLRAGAKAEPTPLPNLAIVAVVDEINLRDNPFAAEIRFLYNPVPVGSELWWSHPSPPQGESNEQGFGLAIKWAVPRFDFGSRSNNALSAAPAAHFPIFRRKRKQHFSIRMPAMVAVLVFRTFAHSPSLV